MKVRCSAESDRTAISGIHRSAFGQEEGPEIVELVDSLMDDETAKPLLSIVAEAHGLLAGHILFTKAEFQPGDQNFSVRILAPLGVARSFQGKGVGGLLIREGLAQLTKAGVDLVFVLGHPGYYPKFGFRPAGVLGLDAPYPIPPEHADAWMVQELKTGVIGSAAGMVQCAETLDQPRYWRE